MDEVFFQGETERWTLLPTPFALSLGREPLAGVGQFCIHLKTAFLFAIICGTCECKPHWLSELVDSGEPVLPVAAVRAEIPERISATSFQRGDGAGFTVGASWRKKVRDMPTGFSGL